MDSDPLRELLEECLLRIEDEGMAALDAFCREHPSEAPILRERIQSLAMLGMLPSQAEQEESIPDRLGDFALLERIGSGGMGVVYLAEQTSLRRRVALKVVRPDQLYVSPRARDRFRREAEAVARLQHPGIVPVHSFGEERGIPYFAMEYVEGLTLTEVIEQFKGRRPETLRGSDLLAVLAPQPAAEAASIPLFAGSWLQTCFHLTQQVAHALQHAHERDVLHRDVKPSNIMVTASGRVLLLDFGLASHAGSSSMTRTGSQLGSLLYMSPESLRGDPDQVTARSDVYSLGVTLYETLTLSRPYASTNPEQTRHLILQGHAPSLRERNPGVPWDAETVCLTAMDPDPERRYSCAAHLARDLANVLDLRSIEARRPSLALRLRRWNQRHPARAVGILLGVLAALIGPLAYGIAQQRASYRIEQALDEARAEKAIAESRLQMVLRLSDLKRLQELETEADDLWPAHPRLEEPMREWLLRAEDLARNLPVHRTTLDSLRDGSLELGDDGAEIEPLEADQKQWWYDTQELLVASLESFFGPTGTMSDLRGRMQDASTLRQRTVEDYEVEWDEAVFEISESSLYVGLEIEPQVGLVPLGPDPQSGLWEFWHVQSGVTPERDLDSEKLTITGESGIVLVLLPGGTFWMGAQDSDTDGPNYDRLAWPQEGPPHQVTLAPFFLSKYEMTQGQWRRFTGQTPSRFGASSPFTGEDPDRHPVEQVSYDDCGTVLHRLGLRLPTEAQWEYGARGGTRTPWWFGDEDPEVPGRPANLADLAYSKGFSTLAETVQWDDGHAVHAPVGTFAANQFGLHDVLGNVSEWCMDWWMSYGGRWQEGDGLRAIRQGVEYQDRVARGGAFHNPLAVTRCANRYHPKPGVRETGIGTRPSRPVDDAR